ncbi:MAG: hypothetical protein ACWGQW_10545 [bacterium]
MAKAKKEQTPEEAVAEKERKRKSDIERRERDKARAKEEKRFTGQYHRFFSVVKPPLDGDGLRAELLRRFIDEHSLTDG